MRLEKMKVLVVEDNLADAQMILGAFRENAEMGFELVFENRVEKAVERLLTEKIGVVLLDLFLPDSFGLDGLERIRRTDPSVPVLVITGFYDNRMGLTALQMGAHCFLPKDNLNGKRLIDALSYYSALV